MTQLLAKLISFPTISSDKEANLACLTWCQKQLKKRNIPTTLISLSGKPLLFWGCNLKSARILINSHIDVVPAPQQCFQPKISGNKLSGRGAADTKGAVSAILDLSQETIAEAVKKGILFSLMTDEEIGGASTKEFIDRLPNLEFGVFAEPSNLNIVNMAKGIMQVKIISKGKTAHGSRPWLGKNSIETLSLNLNNFLRQHPTPTRETTKTTFNFALISGGTAINQIPGECELTTDVRFNPKDHPKQILTEITNCFSDCKVEALKIESPIFCSPNDKHLKRFETVLKNLSVKPKFAFDHGSSDARHCTAKKIPAIVFGPTGKNLHQDSEWVNLKSIDKYQAVIESFIKII